MINIDTRRLIQDGMPHKSDDLWTGSLHEDWNNLPTPQIKGTIGSRIYKAYLEQSGFKAEIINDEGDIQYRRTESDEWIVDEVKAAKATLTVLKSGFVTEKLWFNQIRPGQEGWENIVLVGIYPNHIRIWRMSRKTWDPKYKSLSSVKNGLKHTGQSGADQLEQVTLTKNSKTNNFDEWPCIFTDQQGSKI